MCDPISDCVLAAFRRHCEESKAGQAGRFGKLLLASIFLQSCPPDHIEQLFFSGIIGSVNIEAVIPYVLSMELPGGTSQEAGEAGDEVESDTETVLQES